MKTHASDRMAPRYKWAFDLLSKIDWEANGYKDQWQWLWDRYYDGRRNSSAETLNLLIDDFLNQGLFPAHLHKRRKKVLS